jgi:hypothetical protein
MHGFVKSLFARLFTDHPLAATEPKGIREVRSRTPVPGGLDMTNKPDSNDTAKKPTTPHPNMMGDGTEEQNLGQPGNPAARITKDEVAAAFGKDAPKAK